MFTRFAPSVCFCLILAFLTPVNLSAQQHVVLSQSRSATVQAANGPDPGLIKIHSNLGKKTDAYDDGISWAITGNENPLWGRGSLAMPFTPKASAAAKEVLIALGYLGGGTNEGMKLLPVGSATRSSRYSASGRYSILDRRQHRPAFEGVLRVEFRLE